MPTTARKISSPYPASCSIIGTTCRPNVRKWSIDSVPMWMVWTGILASMFGVAVLYVTW